MPGNARCELVDDDDIGIYHCWSKCVRDEFLCGRDYLRNRNCDHRKSWIERRQELLLRAFAIEMLDYAILDNHLHQVLRTRPDIAARWSEREVVRRWWLIHPDIKRKDGSPSKLTKRRLNGLLQDKERIATWRERLSSLSWFQKELKEDIARRANEEDGVDGHFWSGRFKCVRLLDLAALLVCSIYVDLNVIRAGISSTPEESEHTSIYRRIEARRFRKSAGGRSRSFRFPDASLVPVCESGEVGNETAPWHRVSDQGFLPITTDEYLKLVDWTGRHRLAGKKGAIPEDLGPILERLRVRSDFWVESVTQYPRLFRRAIGHPELMLDAAAGLGQKWLQGVSHCRKVFL
jgi:hypothetical protein